MSEHADVQNRRSTSLTRRAFTREAATAILAGCVITIGDTACGKNPATPLPTESDVNGSVSANHGHVAVITSIQIAAGNAVVLDIRGTATHPHTVSISQADLTSLRNRQTVTRTSTTDEAHSHTVTFTPA